MAEGGSSSEQDGKRAEPANRAQESLTDDLSSSVLPNVAYLSSQDGLPIRPTFFCNHRVLVSVVQGFGYETPVTSSSSHTVRYAPWDSK
jgi:hypothetical protein